MPNPADLPDPAEMGPGWQNQPQVPHAGEQDEDILDKLPQISEALEIQQPHGLLFKIQIAPASGY